MRMTPDEAREAAVALLERLLRSGSWFHTAIELDQYIEHPADGYQLEDEARAIVAAARGSA